MDLRIRSFRQAAFWSTAINAFSQLLSLVFSMVMAAVFGAQESTDVLYYCIGVFALLSGMFQAVNVSVLVPETMRRRHQIGELDAMAFINRFFAAFALLIAGLTAWILWNPAGTMTLISRFSAEALERNSRLVFWLLATLPLQMAAQLLLDVLVSYKFLTLPAALSCVNRILNVAFVWLFHRQLGVLSVALGMLLGFGLQVLFNLYLLKHIIQWNPFAWKTRVGGSVYRNIVWTEIGTLAGTLAGYLPLFLFSGFSAGALTAMNYAQKLSAVPTQLLTSQISNVVGIKFNELAAKRELGDMACSFDQLCRLLVFGLMPLAFGLMLVRHEVVDILFGRGDFGPSVVAQVATLFGVLIFVLPLVAMNTMVSRYFVARQAILQALPFQLLGGLLNAGMVFLCVSRWGVIGYPVGTLFFWILYFLILAFAMPRLFPCVTLWPTLGSLARTVGMGGAVASVVWGIAQWMGFWAWSPWLSAFASIFLFAGLYVAMLMVFSPDRDALQYGLSIWRQFQRRKGERR